MNYFSNLDFQIFLSLNNLAGHNAVFDWLAVFVARDLIFILVPVLLIYYLIKINKPNSKKAIVSGAAAGLFSRYVIVQFIHSIYYRLRPFEAHKVTQLFAKSSEASFPSGHTAALLGIGMALYYFDRKIGITVMVIGLLVGLARIICGIHYPSDVLAGVLVGIFSGLFINFIFNKYKIIK